MVLATYFASLRVRATILVVLFGLGFKANANTSLRGSIPCHYVESTSFAAYYNKLLRSKGTIIIASNSGFKAINKAMGDGGTISEHITKVLHLVFQVRLRHYLGEEGLSVVSVDSPYIKYVKLYAPLGEQQRAVANAQRDAAEYATDYIFGVNSQGAGLIRSFIADPKSIFPPPVFSEDQKGINILPDAERNKLAAYITRVTSEGKSSDFFASTYIAGAAYNSVDAHFMARIRAIDTNRYISQFLFDPGELDFWFDRLQAAKKKTSWMFQGVKKDELLSRFAEIRANLDRENLEDMTPRMRDLLMLYPMRNGPLTSIEMVVAWDELKDYFQILNILDYLPEEKLVLDPNAREIFESLRSPKLLGYWDIRGLGAKNLMAMHESVEQIAGAFAELKLAVANWIAVEDSLADAGSILAVRSRAVKALIEFLSLRRSILFDTDAYVQKVRMRLMEIAKDFGLDGHIAFWASGDDGYFVINRQGVNIQSLLAMALRDPEIRGSIRMGYAQISSPFEKMSLDLARTVVGPSLEVHKYFEALDGDYNLILNSKVDEPNDIQISVVSDRGKLSAVDEIALGLAKKNFPNYKLLTID